MRALARTNMIERPGNHNFELRALTPLIAQGLCGDLAHGIRIEGVGRRLFANRQGPFRHCAVNIGGAHIQHAPLKVHILQSLKQIQSPEEIYFIGLFGRGEGSGY
ncbi:hypothetical protein D3C71_1711010 [compost metagenome]